MSEIALFFRRAHSTPKPGWRARLALWLSAWSERYDLARLDDHALRDIGVRREDALREADRLAFDVSPRTHARTLGS